MKKQLAAKASATVRKENAKQKRAAKEELHNVVTITHNKCREVFTIGPGNHGGIVCPNYQ